MNEIEKMKLKIFLEYINQFDIPHYQCKMKFSDIQEGISPDGIIYCWFHNLLFKDADTFFQECSRYQDVYPKAYQKITVLSKKMSSRLSFFQKVKYFMQYIETHDIPTKNSDIRFCDLGENIQDQSNMGFWLQRVLEGQSDKFRLEILKYQAKYPKAYQKMDFKLSRVKLSFTDRVRHFVDYTDHLGQLNKDKNLTFYQLNPKVFDIRKVNDWFEYQLRNNLENFSLEIEKYQASYPNAFSLIKERILKIQCSINLSFSARVVLYLQYLEHSDVLKSKESLTFHDIDASVLDFTKVSSWQEIQLSTNFDRFQQECFKYQTEYPIGYQKIKHRMQVYRGKVSFEVKVKLFMQYVNSHPIPIQTASLTFHDIDENIQDYARVGTWFFKHMSNLLPRLIEECSKYQNQYPIAYTAIQDKINHSKARLRKERLLLIEELKRVRDQLECNDSKKLIKK